jgi:hypothetical protein
MLPENVPLMSVVAAFCVIEPSLELRVTVALGTGFPLESAAAADSSQGPLGEPALAGDASNTSLATAVTGVIVNCAPADEPPPGVGVVTITTALPAVVSCAAGIIAVNSLVETYVVCSAWLLKFTTDVGAKSMPVREMGVSLVPAATEDGEKSKSTGSGYTSVICAAPD